MSSTNKLNSELRDKLETCRQDLAQEKNKCSKISEELNEATIKQREESEKYQAQIEELEREWNEKLSSFQSVLVMYNELRARSEALEIELNHQENLEGSF